MAEIKLAFNTWVYSCYGSFFPAYTLEETIKRIARIGYEGIEIGAGSPHAYPKHVSPQRRRDTRALLDDSGLTLASMLPAPGGGPGYNPASPVLEERRDTVEQYKEVIQLCSDWGGKLVLYIPGWPVFGTSDQQAWEWSRQALTEIAKAGANCGVTVAIEFMPTKLCESPAAAIRLMEEVGAPNVKLMYDTIHAMARQIALPDPVYELGSNLVHLHLSDSDRLVPGKGRGDFVSLIAALKETEFDGWAAMEIGYDRADVEPDKIAREALDYMRRLIAADSRSDNTGARTQNN